MDGEAMTVDGEMTTMADMNDMSEDIEGNMKNKTDDM